MSQLVTALFYSRGRVPIPTCGFQFPDPTSSLSGALTVLFFPLFTDAITADGQILVYFQKEGLSHFVPPASWEGAVKRTHQEKQRDLQQ